MKYNDIGLFSTPLHGENIYGMYEDFVQLNWVPAEDIAHRHHSETAMGYLIGLDWWNGRWIAQDGVTKIGDFTTAEDAREACQSHLDDKLRPLIHSSNPATWKENYD